MAQTIAARKVKLHDLKRQFGLQQIQADSFFTEWTEALPELTDSEITVLDRIKRNYLYLLEYPVMESIVKMVILSPLLDLAGFYEPPFRVEGERNIKVSAEDEGDIIQGYIDVVVIQRQLWVTTIEAKNSEFSIAKAIPQTLAYMLAAPASEKPIFGTVMNGSEFLFLKLQQDDNPQYATSNLFSLFNRGNDLYIVFRILKQLKEFAKQRT
ncbi:MAG: restriction endonuclease subunit R [Cyanobacteria bacterium J06627_28]